jgi:hypothetical protein
VNRVTFAIAVHHNVVGTVGGHTVKRSPRLDFADALKLLLAELPEGALTSWFSEETDTDTLVIDWNRVPDAIRHGSRRQASWAAGTEER